MTFNSSGIDMQKWIGQDFSDHSLWVNSNNPKLYHSNFRFESLTAQGRTFSFLQRASTLGQKLPLWKAAWLVGYHETRWLPGTFANRKD